MAEPIEIPTVACNTLGATCILPRHFEPRLDATIKPPRLALAGLVLIAPLLILPTSQAQSTTSPGKPEFEVASVRQNNSDEKPYSDFPLNPGPQYDFNGGLLVARNLPLLQYIVFAFKPDMFQIQSFRSHLPEWARTNRFNIEARAKGSPSKDDMRLMMQSLLIERFHLQTHHETHQLPAFAVVLIKAGRLGPDLSPHPPGDPACSRSKLPQQISGGYPVSCGASASIPPRTPGNIAAGGYNITPELLAKSIGGVGSILDRPVLDQTGLTGTYDFRLEFAPDNDSADSPTPAGPAFLQALKEQLGLKLLPIKSPVDLILIDHLDPPSEN